MPRIVLVAGETSGDRLGAGLITELRSRRPGISFAGIAGPAMVAAGCEAWHATEELSVMGLVEVVRHLPRLRRVMATLKARLQADPPDLFIGIDAPDFNLRVERFARRAGVSTVHYVSPSVWAWRAGRVRTLQAVCDHVLCLLPFEADFLERNAVPATFVGHPLADELAEGIDQATARARLQLPPAARVVAVLPGSRRGELQYLGPVFAQTVAWLVARDPALHFVAPMATPALREVFAAQLRHAGVAGRVTLVDGAAHTAMAAASVVLLASGTATLEAMLLERPMVVSYRVSPLTYGLLNGLGLVKVDHVALPNLLAGERLVPELLQGDATPQALGTEVLALLRSPERCAELGRRFRHLRDRLQRGASGQAAAVVLRLLDERSARPGARDL